MAPNINVSRNSLCKEGNLEPTFSSPWGFLPQNGADDGARTRYLHLGKVALYQMSYIRKLVPSVGIEPTTRGFSVLCSTN